MLNVVAIASDRARPKRFGEIFLVLDSMSFDPICIVVLLVGEQRETQRRDECLARRLTAHADEALQTTRQWRRVTICRKNKEKRRRLARNRVAEKRTKLSTRRAFRIGRIEKCKLGAC
jgi:hypothetical protein